jgi:hypothetical protein
MLVVQSAIEFAQKLTTLRNCRWRVARRSVVCIGILAFGWGCRSLPVEIAAPTVERLEVPLSKVAQLETGRTIYTSARKCARCHNPKSVVDHTPTEWTERILPKMAQKAKLSDLEREYLTAYVLAACEARRSVISSR